METKKYIRGETALYLEFNMEYDIKCPKTIIVWKDIVGRVVSFKFKDYCRISGRKRVRHEGVVVLYPRGLGIMCRNIWDLYTSYCIEEMSVIVLPLEEEIIWKIEYDYIDTYPSKFYFLSVG